MGVVERNARNKLKDRSAVTEGASGRRGWRLGKDQDVRLNATAKAVLFNVGSAKWGHFALR
jgi:hypothetical protein